VLEERAVQSQVLQTNHVAPTPLTAIIRYFHASHQKTIKVFQPMIEYQEVTRPGFENTHPVCNRIEWQLTVTKTQYQYKGMFDNI